MTNEDVIKLARATLDRGLCFSRTEHITRATDAELLEFAKQLLAQINPVAAPKTADFVRSNMTPEGVTRLAMASGFVGDDLGAPLLQIFTRFAELVLVAQTVWCQTTEEVCDA